MSNNSPGQFSYSRVGTFAQCPRKFKLHYHDQLRVIQDPAADDALIVGNSLHLGIETTIQNMLEHYYSHYTLVDDKQVNEAIKLELLVHKVYKLLEGVNILHQEYEINQPEFKGIVDLVTLNPDGTVDIFDFKYSNNIERYIESEQLHIYKYYMEQLGFKVNKLGFIFVPKTGIRQKKTETIHQFRNRLIKTIEPMKIQVVEVEYNIKKVLKFSNDCNKITMATDYPKNETRLCDWCDFKNYCKEGETYMLLPENKKREINLNQGIKLWIYGSPFVGKSYLANQFEDAIFLNTDGNVKFIDSPYLMVKDDIKAEGRIKTRIFAWDTFVEAIDEILIGKHEFKTIVVDILDDIYEAARLKTYDKLGVEHEHDAGFGKGYDMVRTEFLPQIRRLMNSNYNVILISHEVVSEFTKKTGDKVSTVATPLPVKIANKLAGMVDIVARVTNEAAEGRVLTFKSSQEVFGGGRLTFTRDKFPCSHEELMKEYNRAALEMGHRPTKVVNNEGPQVNNAAPEEKPKRSRKKKEV